MELNGVSKNYYNEKSKIVDKGKKSDAFDLFGQRMSVVNQSKEKKSSNAGRVDTYTRNEEVQNVYSSYNENGIEKFVNRDVCAVGKCEPKDISYKDADFVKVNICDGYVLSAKYDEEDGYVYVNKKMDDGTVESFKVDMRYVDDNSTNPIEIAAKNAYKFANSKESYSRQFVKELEEYAEYVQERIEEGPEKIQIGGACMSIEEWKELLAKVDKYIDEMKASMRKDIERREEEIEEKKLQEKKDEELLMSKVSSLLTDRIDNTPKAPYYYMADENGVIEYNGVVFVCDNEHKALCLGDMSNPDDVLTIPLSKGGTLKVNRNNLGDLAKAITMFSAEDINLIMRAIAQDAKIQKVKKEIDDMVGEAFL